MLSSSGDPLDPDPARPDIDPVDERLVDGQRRRTGNRQERLRPAPVLGRALQASFHQAVPLDLFHLVPEQVVAELSQHLGAVGVRYDRLDVGRTDGHPAISPVSA